MNKMISVLILLSLSLVLVVACAPEPPPPPEPEEPPEPTPEEYRQQIRGMLGALLQPGVPALSAPPLVELQGRKSQLMATDNGRAALNLVTRDIEDAIKLGKEEERWGKLAALCRVFRVFEPENTRYEKTREYADLMLKRPKVTVTGFMEMGSELYVFIDLFDPETGQTTTHRIREGEEFYETMRLIRVIGNQQAVEVEYLPLSYAWVCDGPKERARAN